jgi:hypothetical protein
MSGKVNKSLVTAYDHRINKMGVAEGDINNELANNKIIGEHLTLETFF